MTSKPNRTTADKIALFRRFFSGLPNVYGTYDPPTGRIRQVKQPVNDAVILGHLRGRQPYGVYLLVANRTGAVVADFDVDDIDPPMASVARAANYGLTTYIERSKSKGYHVWLFLTEGGVPAVKARRVVRHILDEIAQPNVEVFPKHDCLDAHVQYGNFIFTPLFGGLLPDGRTIFMEPNDPSKPCSDQWQLLERIERVGETRLDEIIELNGLAMPSREISESRDGGGQGRPSIYGLPPCTQRMLREGVRTNQRVICFRLGVALKRSGLPFEMSLSVLSNWAQRNRPSDGKRVITPAEIKAQTRDAYRHSYRSFGCEHEAIRPFCDPTCPIRSRAEVSPNNPAETREPDPANTFTRSKTMTTSPTNRPIKDIRVRNVSLAIWQNEGIRNGRPVTLHSVTLNKRYHDKEADEWKDSNSFFPDDLPRLRLLLDKAYEHILLRDRDTDREKPEPSATKPADAVAV